MFNKKEQKDLEVASCETCKHLLYKKDACEVTVTIKPLFIGDIPTKKNAYFCPEHKKNYKEEVIGFGRQIRYYKEMEVDSHGEPIGYKKIK